MINDTTKTKPVTLMTPSNCDAKLVSVFVIGTASVPQIPANKWTGIAPTTSSIFNLNNSFVPATTILHQLHQ